MPLVSVTLHWLLSQSLFLGNIGFFFYDGRLVKVAYCVGYSCIGIIASLAGGIFTVIVGLLMSCRRYEAGMPLLRNSSGVIAAACHPMESEDGNMVYQPLKWGVVSMNDEGISHCAFSCEEDLKLPREGGLCAGEAGLKS